MFSKNCLFFFFFLKFGVVFHFLTLWAREESGDVFSEAACPAIPQPASHTFRNLQVEKGKRNKKVKKRKKKLERL